MISISVKVESDFLIKSIYRKLRNKKKKNDMLESMGNYMVSSTINKIRENISPPNAPLTVANKKNNLTLRDTGTLMGSITYKVDLSKQQVRFGTNVFYAPVAQFGAVIRPKRAKKLAIPAGWETRRLMRRYGFVVRRCIEGLKKAGWRIWFTDGAIMGKKGKKGKPRVLFIRKDSVNVHARPFLFVSEEDKKKLTEIAFHHLRGI